MCNASLSGLVAITAGCDAIDLPFAALTGTVAGAIYCCASAARARLRIDDVVDAFAVHGVSGAWGCIAYGLFARGEPEHPLHLH
jgi:Amt family ammonium transporter